MAPELSIFILLPETDRQTISVNILYIKSLLPFETGGGEAITVAKNFFQSQEIKLYRQKNDFSI